MPQNATGGSLATAAVSAGFFERTCIFRGRSEVALGSTLAQHPSSVTFEAVGITATVRNHTLQGAVLDANSLILFQDGEAIPETAYFEPAHAVRHLPNQPEPTLIPDKEDLIFGYNNAHRGYQHWLTQCIPAIDWSLRQKRSRPVRLILPHLECWQTDFLVLLGCEHIPRLIPEAGTRYRLPRVEYSDFLHGTTSFAICLSALDTARRIAQAVPSASSDDKILYINDPGPYYGSIRNQDAVLDLLRRGGVAVVEPSRLRTAERINLFRNADVVIGPLGQGLTDVIFCRPGALLWEWMPRHHQNASFNRLAQAAQVDYWGDLFETVSEPDKPRQWEVDLALVADRLAELSTRMARRAVAETTCDGQPVTGSLGGRPIDELMLSFESLGDNCEFGLVQRHAGVEPLGLLRFNGFHVPPEFRLEKLVAALENGFDGLGASGTITVFPDGLPGRRELIVRDSVYDFWYHSGIAEGDIEPEVQSRHETIRLGFLRRKLFEDLAAGDKIWVWKSQATKHRDQLGPLLAVLRRLGPNTILWVVETDEQHPPGSVELLEPDFIKGYIDHFAPYGAVSNIHFASWFELCCQADELRRPDQAAAEPDAIQQVPIPPSTAMEALARGQRATPCVSSATTSTMANAHGIWAWLRRRWNRKPPR